jgi:hypothetical protein
MGGAGSSGGSAPGAGTAGNGGNGGVAKATSTTTTNLLAADAAISKATAIGGTGAPAGAFVSNVGLAATTAGNGGDAIANASFTDRGTGTANAVATAIGGNSGSVNLSFPGMGGNANATANATSGAKGTANATSIATAGMGGTPIPAGSPPGTLKGPALNGKAVAISTGNAGAGMLMATANGKTTNKASAVGGASAQQVAAINSMVIGEAVTDASEPNIGDLAGTQAGALVTGDVQPVDWATEITQNANPNVFAALGKSPDTLGAVHLSGNYLTGASGLQSYSSFAKFQIDPTQLVDDDVQLGLLSGWGVGSDTSLQFSILINGNQYRSPMMFSSVFAADAYFKDDVIDLGPAVPGSDGYFNLEFDMTATGATDGDSYMSNFVIATVPEPTSICIVGVFVAAQLMQRRRKT